MKVSFLVTYYNQEQYVSKSIESILAIDKDFEWEILVGDDGSTDSTTSEIKKYIELYPNRIKLFVIPRELKARYHSVKRASENRLTLLEHAEGDFFCVLDGDDFYCDKYFVKQALQIFENDRNIATVAYGYCYFTNEELQKAVIIPEEGNKPYVNKIGYLRDLYVHAGACVYRKAFGIERIREIKRIGYFDDNDIVINNLCYGEMVTVGRTIYAYRQTGFSVYTGMTYLEQAVLNVQGYDVDCNIAPQFKEELLYRNRREILFTYFMRHRIKQSLGEKWKLYVEESKTISHSLVSSILDYDNLKREKKHFIDCLAFKLIWKYKKTTIEVLSQCLKGR